MFCSRVFARSCYAVSFTYKHGVQAPLPLRQIQYFAPKTGYFSVEPARIHMVSAKAMLCTTCTGIKNLNMLNLSFRFQYCIRGFNVTSKKYVNPIIWVVLRPVLKIAAALTGRGIRKWWKDLPPNKKQYIWGLLKQNRLKILVFVSASSMLFYVYYRIHLELTPITNRKRFMAFDPKQLQFIGEHQFKEILKQFERDILPPHHRHTKRVASVVNQLIQANKDVPQMQQKTFTIAVVDSSVENAFVLPNGEIFVFVGMLNLCSNNDQLGSVLAHELSHCILAHAVENFSFAHLVDMLMVIFIGIIWTLLPSDILAAITHWMMKQLTDISVNLPYNRKIETEADEVGLTLAAKACFDVRENSAFWSKMAILEKNFHEVPDIEFLSTHPSHENRSTHIDCRMEEALKLRSECGCPKLKAHDPRLDIANLTKLLEDERRRYRTSPQLLILAPQKNNRDCKVIAT